MRGEMDVENRRPRSAGVPRSSGLPAGDAREGRPQNKQTVGRPACLEHSGEHSGRVRAVSWSDGAARHGEVDQRARYRSSARGWNQTTIWYLSGTRE